MLGRVFVAIEKMLRVVDHLATVFHQMGDGVADHRLVFRDGGAQNLGDLELPAFSENGNDGRFGLQQQTDLRILFDRRVRSARGAKRGELRVAEFEIFGLAEELDVLWI